MDKIVTPSRHRVWLDAARPRALPLAIGSIATGCFLAAADGVFNAGIAALAVLTAVLLQVLSNFSNDYGDSVHGADSAERKGPQRAVQSGAISAAAMCRAMLVTAILAIISGIALVWLALGAQGSLFVGFLVLGAAAIWAAINYTAGSKPYGYAGFGDLSVLLFFGLCGVLGAYYLQAGRLNGLLLLPATSVGLLAVAVLNVNNIRDMNSDARAGKLSIPVRIGLLNARRYHWSLLCSAAIAALMYVALSWRGSWQLLFLISLPQLFKNGKAVATLPREQLDPLLKHMVFSSLLFVLTFGIGQLLA